MPISDSLLKILVCPETKTPVTVASAEFIRSLNDRITKGEIKNRKGSQLNQKLVEALVRQDGKVAYPIVDGIPVMIIDEAIDL